MNAADALRTARHEGVRFRVAGTDLILDADREPSPGVLEALRRHKAEIVSLLTAEENDWTSEQIVAFLLRSHEYGDVWLARNDEAAAERTAHLKEVDQLVPVITFDEAALLRGKSERMLRALLTAMAALPGSRLLQ